MILPNFLGEEWTSLWTVLHCLWVRIRFGSALECLALQQEWVPRSWRPLEMGLVMLVVEVSYELLEESDSWWKNFAKGAILCLSVTVSLSCLGYLHPVLLLQGASNKKYPATMGLDSLPLFLFPHSSEGRSRLFPTSTIRQGEGELFPCGPSAAHWRWWLTNSDPLLPKNVQRRLEAVVDHGVVGPPPQDRGASSLKMPRVLEEDRQHGLLPPFSFALLHFLRSLFLVASSFLVFLEFIRVGLHCVVLSLDFGCDRVFGSSVVGVILAFPVRFWGYVLMLFTSGPSGRCIQKGVVFLQTSALSISDRFVEFHAQREPPECRFRVSNGLCCPPHLLQPRIVSSAGAGAAGGVMQSFTTGCFTTDSNIFEAGAESETAFLPVLGLGATHLGVVAGGQRRKLSFEARMMNRGRVMGDVRFARLAASGS